MPSKAIQIPAPINGLSDDTSYSQQPPGTTREALNARAIESKTGRTRISQRSGLKLYDPDGPQVNGANIIQDLIAVSKNEDLLTYADDTSGGGGGPGNVFKKTMPGPRQSGGDGDCTDLRMDAYGNLYAAQRVTGVYKFNQDGEKLAEILVPEAEPSAGKLEVAAFAIDEFGNVAVAMGGAGSSNVAQCRLHFFEAQLDGTYRRAWSIDSGRAFSEVAFYQGDIYTLESDVIPGNTSLTGYFCVYRNYSSLEAPVEDEAVEEPPVEEEAASPWQ